MRGGHYKCLVRKLCLGDFNNNMFNIDLFFNAYVPAFKLGMIGMTEL